MAKGWTFQSLIDEKMTVRAFCHAPCHHSQVLDLVKLRDRFGPDAPAMESDIRPKLKCAKCGGKKVGLIYTPDATPNAYGKARDWALDQANGSTMKHKPSKSGFAKLLAAGTTLMSVEPLIGLLELETDSGTVQRFNSP